MRLMTLQPNRKIKVTQFIKLIDGILNKNNPFKNVNTEQGRNMPGKNRKCLVCL